MASEQEEPREIEWREVVSGDQLKSVKNGRFYPVLGTARVIGGYRIRIRAGGKSVSIDRPTAAEPKAVVIRGETGKAVDVFVEVFSS